MTEATHIAKPVGSKLLQRVPCHDMPSTLAIDAETHAYAFFDDL